MRLGTIIKVWAGLKVAAWLLVMAWRFTSGAHMDGVERTDAGWIERGTRALTRTGRASRWAYMPRLKRAAWRLGTTTAAAVTSCAYAVYPVATEVTAGTLAAGGSYVAGRRGVRAWQVREHRRRVVRPLHAALRGPLGLPAKDAGEKWLDVPRAYRDDPDAVVRLHLPDSFLGDDGTRRLIADTMRRRLGGEWDAHWRLDEYPLSVELRQPPAPPAMVKFADALPIMARAQRGKVFLGKGTRDEEIWLDLDAETPHVAMSMGTGGGKSSTLRVILSQLARGEAERVMILDPKQVSHRWARGIPGVDIYCAPDEWASAIAEFRTEMDRRYAEISEHGEEREFPRWVLVVEEMNSMTALLRQWWAKTRDKDDPKNPPALDDLGFCLFMGRQAVMNVLAVLQQANARAMGGSDFRDQFGCKILARFSPQVWNMLVGTYPRPKSSRHPGRAIVLIGDDEMRAQLAFFTEDEARAYALNDRQAVTVTPARTVRDHRDADVTVTGRPSLTVIDGGEPERVTLAEAARLQIVPMTYDALRQAKSRRDKNGFPAGVTRDGKTTYTPHELRAWRAVTVTGGRGDLADAASGEKSR